MRTPCFLGFDYLSSLLWSDGRSNLAIRKAFEAAVLVLETEVSSRRFRTKRTLAAGLTHASRTPRKGSGRRVSNAWESTQPYGITHGNVPTKATIHSWSERMISHIGTETRPKLLREAAVGNIGQWAQA
ncbi:hypothetical protein Lal_00001509 [Lupinus albus]|nr:hypothetical protein Lal_00001509 [Lupinus albus]